MRHPVETTNLWSKCLEVIKDNVSDKAYNTWFTPIVPVKYEVNDFTIQVPSQFFYEYLEVHYAHLIYSTLCRISGKNLVLYYRIIVDTTSGKEGHTILPSDNNRFSNNELKKQATDLNKSPKGPIPSEKWDSHLNSRLSFANFFEGESNILARRVGEAIAGNPGKGYNPLFIHGASGVGKTHLCHAIGNKISDNFPDKKVMYISSHLFQVQFTDSARANTTNDFINFYQGVDVLIIDDIQDLAGKEKTQKIYFHIFNHLHLLGKQIILTSDKSPVELQDLQDRLISRFKCGMTAELFKPNLELRRKILVNKIKQNGLIISDEIVDYIAENVTDHVRDLEGIITSLVAHSVLFQRDIDLEIAKMVVGKTVKGGGEKKITPEQIQNNVSTYLNIDIKDIQSQSRKREIVQARQITMFLIKKYTDYSYSHIGNLIGKRDHATVVYACKAVQDNIDVDKSFRITINNIEDRLKRG
jgi:chromosomal replication initiator protein